MERTTLGDSAVQKNAHHSTQLIIRETGILLDLNIACRDSQVSYVSISGKQRACEKKPPTNRLCQLPPDMVVMQRHNVKLVILFHIVGTYTEEEEIKQKDMDTQDEKMYLGARKDTVVKGRIGTQTGLWTWRQQ